MSEQFCVSPLSQMGSVLLYQVLRLRADVFVVEQECIYPDPDGRDLEDDCLQAWVLDGDRVAAASRILHEGDALKIGRVVAHPDYRGTGVARRMFQFTLEQCEKTAPGAEILLHAQAPLRAWYESFGFHVTGDAFLEDGIPHLPMSNRP